eukprot:m.180095 g.180095  ORF g.180095 m.180095 type:complete len:190 (+) comp14928_c0_seq1:206-775(+)
MNRAARALLTHSRLWYKVDAKGQRPGHLAASICEILQGKYKPTYDAGADVGDNVVVVNTQHINFSGSKWKGKVYRKHTSFPGGFREVQAKKLHEDHPTRVVELAVKGMLPKNKLRNAQLRRLFLFANEDNPYEDAIFADVELPKYDDTTSTIPPNIIRPGSDMHVLENMIEEGDWELVADIPAITEKTK